MIFNPYLLLKIKHFLVFSFCMSCMVMKPKMCYANGFVQKKMQLKWFYLENFHLQECNNRHILEI